MADITDPRAIKALAHPLRLQLLQALGVRLTATATQLSDDVDESPSNCSFHLRKLAEFGYIVRADGAAGRDKPWRLRDPTQNLQADLHDPAAVEASVATWSAVLEWDFGTLRAAAGRQNPPEWEGATMQSGATMLITPAEALSINDALHAVLQPYIARLTDHSLVPPGAGVVRMLMASAYLPHHQQLIDRDIARSHHAEPSTAEQPDPDLRR